MNAKDIRSIADDNISTAMRLIESGKQPNMNEIALVQLRMTSEIAAQLAEINRHYEQGPELDLSLPAVEMMVARHLEIEAAPERVLYSRTT